MRISTSLLTALFLLATLFGTSGTGQAQIPYVAIYFDENLTQMARDCQGVAVYDTVSVVVHNLNAWIKEIEFGFVYPAEVLEYWNDIVLADSSFSVSPYGISLFWNEPQNAFAPLVVHKIAVIWLCSDCREVPGYGDSIPLQPVSHPVSGDGLYVDVIQWPDSTVIKALPLTSLVCPSFTGTRQSTWGAIKSLYR